MLIRRFFGLACATLLLGLASASWADDLHEAVKADDSGRVRALLAAGANVEEVDLFGTPLHIAAAKNSAEIVTLLLDAGANIEAEAVDSESRNHPLHIAALVDAVEVAKLLIARGAKVDARNRHGQTPLLMAAAHGKAGVVEPLLSAGADPLAEDQNYRDTALHCAAFTNQPDTIKLLLARGVDVNLRSHHNGETPLYYAVLDNRTTVVELLLASGADPRIPDKNGKTPLDMKPDPKIQELLEKYNNSLLEHHQQ